eukprot:TRINITY_DN12745_c0_g1_i1.p1 TRINITY_DN12745_c0_g1~~TRINITY_DN12745_c0_g1_i1.p1  ORF type:complete len:223 (-),score=47.03 TRINITY_DN12745_c0_g1_i1:200-775(-)
MAYLSLAILKEAEQFTMLIESIGRERADKLKDYLTAANEDIERDVNKLSLKLNELFGAKITAWDQLQKFLRRKLEPDETPENYLMDKEQLWVKTVEAVKDCKGTWKDDLFLEAAIAGIPYNIRPNVKSLVNKLEERGDFTRLGEVMRAQRKLTQTKDKPKPVSPKRPTCHRCGKLGHWTKNCWAKNASRKE